MELRGSVANLTNWEFDVIRLTEQEEVDDSERDQGGGHYVGSSPRIQMTATKNIEEELDTLAH